MVTSWGKLSQKQRTPHSPVAPSEFGLRGSKISFVERYNSVAFFFFQILFLHLIEVQAQTRNTASQKQRTPSDPVALSELVLEGSAISFLERYNSVDFVKFYLCMLLKFKSKRTKRGLRNTARRATQ